MIDREEAHRRLDAVLDALEHAAHTTSSDARIRAEQTAIEESLTLQRDLVSAVFARHRTLGALLCDRAEASCFEAVDLEREGQRQFDGGQVDDLQAVTIRRALAVSSLWAGRAGLMQPGMGEALARGAYWVNLGDASFLEWLIPKPKKGRRGNGAAYAAVGNLGARVYYLAGYRNASVEHLWASETKRLKLGFNWEAFDQRMVRDPDLKIRCHGARDRGKEHSKRGFPENPPVNLERDQWALRGLALGQQTQPTE